MVLIAQVAGVLKDGGGKDSTDVGGPSQRDVARGTLERAAPSQEPGKSGHL